jgi:tetratricopeptide (TPR) repeat protein
MAWNNRGYSLYKLGRTDEAMKDLKKSLDIEPDNSFAWDSMGEVFVSAGNYEEGFKCYDKALEIDPDYTTTLYNKVMLSQNSVNMKKLWPVIIKLLSVNRLI